MCCLSALEGKGGESEEKAMKKYEFTDETIRVVGRTLHRIRAVTTFLNTGRNPYRVINSGELGGFIEREENLSQTGGAWVYDNAKVLDGAAIHGEAKVFGDVEVSGQASLSKNAMVLDSHHLLVVGPIGSRNSYTTFFRNMDKDIFVNCGCFCGNIDEFLLKVFETHGENRYAMEYKAVAEAAKAHMKEE